MKVITFSKAFPATHPRKGQPTKFKEKIWLWGHNEDGWSEPEYFPEYKGHVDIMDILRQNAPKYHTIRAGNRWKEGDWFSPRVWSGKPYASKQIEFAPPIQIKKIWEFDIKFDEEFWFIKLDGRNVEDITDFNVDDFMELLAKNDGLSLGDFLSWFQIHPKSAKTEFHGQILCWNKSVNYFPIEITTP